MKVKQLEANNILYLLLELKIIDQLIDYSVKVYSIKRYETGTGVEVCVHTMEHKTLKAVPILGRYSVSG